MVLAHHGRLCSPQIGWYALIEHNIPTISLGEIRARFTQNVYEQKGMEKERKKEDWMKEKLNKNKKIIYAFLIYILKKIKGTWKVIVIFVKEGFFFFSILNSSGLIYL